MSVVPTEGEKRTAEKWGLDPQWVADFMESHLETLGEIAQERHQARLDRLGTT